ncbi:SUN domain-containing protein 1 isoform X7 [Nelusetta ayraudi]|uniref:SUN domain-containing protein 1 isoform X7 n=1 Tax=Nelusetta ayraudi TaxID=303726 RepID=UPI003F72D611
MQEESKHRGVKMDFSQLHTYTPPQCAPDNTGYTYSLSSSYSTAALEFEREHHIPAVYESPRMSRRSLRLQSNAAHDVSESPGDLFHSSSSSSSYTSTRRETRTLRGKKQHATSGSLSLSLSQAATPTKTLCFSAASTPLHNNNNSSSSSSSSSKGLLQESSTQCDGAHQLSSIQEQPHLRQRTVTTTTTTTLVDGRWGHSDHASSSINGNASVSKSHSSHGNGYICKDCTSHSHSHKSDSFISHSASSALSSQAAEASSDILSSTSSSPFTSIYSRDRSRRTKTGVLSSLCSTCVRNGKRVLAPVSSLVTLLFSSVLWLRSKAKSPQGEAHPSFCVSMNVKDLVTEDAATLKLNGSLCSYLRQPGHCVVNAGKALGSGASSAFQKLLLLFWMLVAAPGKVGREVLWFLASGWFQFVSLMSVLNVFFLTRCLPKLWMLLLLLLPLLLLLALWLWGPSTAALLAYLPAINLTEWSPASFLTLLASMVPASAPAPPSPAKSAPVAATETPFVQTPASPASQAPPIIMSASLSAADLERLERLEHQLTLLWEKVQQGDQKQDARHGDVLGLYSTLKEQLHTETNKEILGLWVSTLLDQRLAVLRGELDQESAHREKSEEEQKRHQESEAARLADLELLLKVLAAKTKEVQQKQQQYEHERLEKEREETTMPAADPLPVSVGVKQEEHDALLVEVQRLEAELGKVRQDLLGVLGCKGKCEQLATLQETISAQVSSQVRKELQALFYGSGDAGGELPESLLLWLSQRYVSTPDLRASLAALEMNILKNVSQQLELQHTETLDEAESHAKLMFQTVTGTVQHAAAAEGLTEEQVKLIVQNALRLYSQDRTGLVDYALESGGGSILSTRCSETYETKTALMSLFGLPLWYFSQSPRVVIQPDVYPGNCWAFKGSQGYLVIRLSLRIRPVSFCLEHIPKALSPTGNITSAPRNFTVHGLDDEYQEEGKLLGHYTYQEDGESLQSFPVTERNDKAFQIIEVRVLSNWGHPEYTCLYRFRVHGEPRPQ